MRTRSAKAGSSRACTAGPRRSPAPSACSTTATACPNPARVTNLFPGSYRLALHERGNCSSPNLFSAGPAWAPAVWTKPAANLLLPGFIANEEGQVSGYVVYIKGMSVSGPASIKGRSFVIHAGSLVGEAFPGQPNNRVACGVLVDAQALF